MKRKTVSFLFLFLILRLSAAGQPADTTLYTVGYSHLDTEWRWDYRTTIRDYLKNTLNDNFRLFGKYPNYVFNFSGANRYRMMKEYYPQEYELVKKYAGEGRWFPCGSSVEENDVLIPSAESILRQVLYGNRFFSEELDKTSNEYMLPDCFGFPASLPSILSHCGIKGFSTQKLTWGSAVGIPFNIGRWAGPDGNYVVAAFNPGEYVGEIKEDLSRSQKWIKRIADLGARSGIFREFAYYGTGDVGGAPSEESVAWVEKSIAGGGPVRVLSATADRFFNDLTDGQVSRLPEYRGELLLTNHSAGSLSSQAYMKRCNRKNELLAYSAEAASVVGDWLGGLSYPREKLNEAWRLLLGAQFHDIMAGTCTPKSYEYSWNDELLAANQFSDVLTNSVSAVCRALDTKVKGTPLVVFNPLAIEREDLVEATITLGDSAGKFIRVYGPDQREVQSQTISRTGSRAEIVFLAKVPSVGFAVFDIRASEGPPEIGTELSITDSTLESSRFFVRLNGDGDISSIYDKRVKREILSAPARLEFQREIPMEYPAWNMDWADRVKPPYSYVKGGKKIRIAESGPARVALEVERESNGSEFTQTIRLGAGECIEYKTAIDWFTKESSLKQSFPLTVSNPLATYSAGIGTVRRGNNDQKKYEVPSHQWFDLTDPDGRYGVSVLEDSKFGSDKPEDNTLRLTLLYTPGIRNSFKDQASQDFGKHEILYALYPHEGEWKKANSYHQASRLNQPLTAFQTQKHGGFLGNSFSFMKLNSRNVMVQALKYAEDSSEVLVRLAEMDGSEVMGLRVQFHSSVISARELDGQERFVRDLKLSDGTFSIDLTPHQIRTIAFTLKENQRILSVPVFIPYSLTFDADVISTEGNKADGSFDGTGASFPAEMLPPYIMDESAIYMIGPAGDGEKNAVVCRGQELRLNPSPANKLYILAASTGETTTGVFIVGDRPVEVRVDPWSGFIGQWDNRKWTGLEEKKQDFAWDDAEYTGLEPGYVRKSSVAHFSTHRHLPGGENDPYSYAYLYKYSLDLPEGTKSVRLPVNEKIRILAMTGVYIENGTASPARPLFDTLGFSHEDYARFQRCAMPQISPSAGIIEKGRSVTVAILSPDGSGICFTTDGTDPTPASHRYVSPFEVDSTSVVKAISFKAGSQPSGVRSAPFHEAWKISKVDYLTRYSGKYPGRGDSGLIDGLRGSESFSDKSWQGFEGADMEVVADLGAIRSLGAVTIGCLSDNTSWIFLPLSVELFSSEDGENYSELSREQYDLPEKGGGNFTKEIRLRFEGKEARFLKIKCKNAGQCPPWHPGAGGKAWLFVDEIIVE